MKSAAQTTYYAPPSRTEHQSNQRLKRAGLLIGMWFSLVIMVAFNLTSQFMPLYGTGMLEVSDGFTVLFKPAGFTFAIWGLIYIGLFIWMIAFTRYITSSSHIHQTANDKGASQRLGVVGGLFIVSCALNIAWLIAWHLYAYVTSVVLIGALLITLIVLTRTTRSTLGGVALQPQEDTRTARLHTIAISAPLSLYLGWIIVATITNIVFVATLMNSAFATLDPTNMIIVVALGVGLVLIGALARYIGHDLVMPAVFAWSLIGIGFHLMPLTSALAAAYLSLAVVLVLAVYVPYQRIAHDSLTTPAHDTPQ